MTSEGQGNGAPQRAHPTESSVGHTPGPWFVHQIPGIEQAGKMYPISAHDDPMGAIAYVGAQGRPNLANAKLVAAAPDLLAALKKAAEGYENAVEFGFVAEGIRGAMVERMLEWRALIAKAEGAAHE